MRFWIREIGGWLLVLAGLYFCLASLSLILAQPSRPLSAIHTTVIGIFVFRGGIHLLKVSLAARLASALPVKEVQAKTPPARVAAPRQPVVETW